VNNTPILYAPNVHIGGGLVLLKALLDAWQPDKPLRAFLDERVRNLISVAGSVAVHWVAPRIGARFAAQRQLRRESSETTTVLCFNGLPPLLPIQGYVVVFQQNRLHLTDLKLGQYGMKVALRLVFERFASHVLRHRVHLYIVQTPSMASALAQWHGSQHHSPFIAVVPFASSVPAAARAQAPTKAIEWDFVYVADAMPHKNHRTLCEAWRLLAQDGIRPRLALTLAPTDVPLLKLMAQLRHSAEVDIVNVGRLPHAQILNIYSKSRALIFPSVMESFGLPLLEARQCNLPIIASELDFVREICDPVQTFDPHSAVSIARAVRRFLGLESTLVKPAEPDAFWDYVLRAADQPRRQHK
jgi:glycosyltransferase involved in cell wall biosynthesis